MKELSGEELDQIEIVVSMQSKSQYVSDLSTGINYDSYCVYWDEELGKWSEEGVTKAGNVSSSGVINCTTIHLSQFSFNFRKMASGSGSTVNETVVDNTTTNDSNSTNATITYFHDYKGAYIAIVLILTVWVYASIALAIIFPRVTLNFALPQLDKIT